jgi:hypothetical protein
MNESTLLVNDNFHSQKNVEKFHVEKRKRERRREKGRRREEEENALSLFIITQQ